MKLRSIWIACVAALLLGVACKKPAPKVEEKPIKETKAVASATAAPAAEDLSNLPVVTEEDFEEQAEKEITLDNLESELDRMEKEIGQ